MHEEKFHRESVEGVEAVLERMWEAVGRPLLGYAKSFDVSENDIKNWRRRGRVSRAYLEGFAAEHGVSLDWLLYGEAAAPPTPGGSGELLSEDERRLLDSYRRSSPEIQAAAQRMLKPAESDYAKRVTVRSGQRPESKLKTKDRIEIRSSERPEKKFRPPKKRGGDE